MNASDRPKICAPTEDAIAEAGRMIRSGGLVAFPTETVYGLGADALSPDAARKIYEAKGRPQDNPLIVHVASHSDVDICAEPNDIARTLIEKFWPGPLTVVMRARDAVPPQTRAGLSTVALRMPSRHEALAVIRAAGVPIAAPSANKSGRPSPTDAQTVARDLGNAVDMIIDGGSTDIGLESTVVDTTEDRAVILRSGAITREEIAKIVPVSSDDSDDVRRRSPGTRHRHYAPKVPVLLWSPDENDGDIARAASSVAWSYMGMREPFRASGTLRRKMIFADENEYARELFSSLRELEKDCDAIVAEMPGDAGISAAIRDRLIRAAGADR